MFPQAPRKTCRKRNDGDEDERSAADICDAHSNATRCDRRQTLDEHREHQRKNEGRCQPNCAREECGGETTDDSLCVRHKRHAITLNRLFTRGSSSTAWKSAGVGSSSTTS
jgi:hypothetical protein